MITFEHPELGLVQLRTRMSARRQIIKVTQRLVIITVPPGFEDLVFPLSEETIEKILRLREKVVKRSGEGCFNIEEEIVTMTFRVVIGWQENPKIRVYGARLDDGVLRINMPMGVDIETDVVQMALKRIVLKFLRQEAERVLPERLD
jgi:hypothetical protein